MADVKTRELVMKIYFENAQNVIDAIKLVEKDLGITISEKSLADITVCVKEEKDFALNVSLRGKCAEISYGGGRATFLRGLAMLVYAVKCGETEKTVTEAPVFTLNGAMVDMSRNAVMNVNTVKFMLRKMALMGQNAFMLYNLILRNG